MVKLMAQKLNDKISSRRHFFEVLELPAWLPGCPVVRQTRAQILRLHSLCLVLRLSGVTGGIREDHTLKDELLMAFDVDW